MLLLKNMVAPGEVDAELAREVKEECAKFGPVNSCTVYEHKVKSKLESWKAGKAPPHHTHMPHMQKRK